jgi:hypothetical protein
LSFDQQNEWSPEKFRPARQRKHAQQRGRTRLQNKRGAHRGRATCASETSSSEELSSCARECSAEEEVKSPPRPRRRPHAYEHKYVRRARRFTRMMRRITDEHQAPALQRGKYFAAIFPQHAVPGASFQYHAASTPATPCHGS